MAAARRADSGILGRERLSKGAGISSAADAAAIYAKIGVDIRDSTLTFYV